MQNNLYISPNQTGPIRVRQYPACLMSEDVAALLGLPIYTIPMLVRAKHLKPLGRPAQNARKWFARAELHALMQDRAWLDKAVNIVERCIREMNLKCRNREQAARAKAATESVNATEA